MPFEVNPSKDALEEALALSEETLRGLELGQITLTLTALRASRLARLLNEFDHQKIFEYEAGGYPSAPLGVSPEIWALAERANRIVQKIETSGFTREYVILDSIEQLEAKVESAKLGIDAARDASTSISSANPNQYVYPQTNMWERQRLHEELNESVRLLGARRSFVYAYISQKYLELKFSTIASDSFSRIRDFVDGLIGKVIPASVQKFTAIYEYLLSENSEDWSNAVHSCRRVLQDLADVLFPARDEPIVENINGKERTIQLGPGNYINRLICYASDRGSSETTIAIIGSQLSFLGDRLDAIFHAAHKGSHSVISSREEADRYVVYTYMIVGDLLRLLDEPKTTC
jgi:hypothetical protein